MEYVNEEAFQFIKDSYEEVNFSVKFEPGNIEEYGCYKEKYGQLLNIEVPLFDWEKNEEVYLRDFTRDYYDEGLKNMDYSEYDFYFFDINEDGAPELCINHQRGYFLYVFRYDKEKDRVFLWRRFIGGWRSLLGSGAVDDGWSDGDYHRFTRYDEVGNMTVTVWFFDDDFWLSGENVYMVALPTYFDKQENAIKREIPEEIKKQGYFDEGWEIYYFPVTKEQYQELVGDFFSTDIRAMKKRKEMEYSYEELFEQ